jgi:hypothetical protein
MRGSAIHYALGIPDLHGEDFEPEHFLEVREREYDDMPDAYDPNEHELEYYTFEEDKDELDSLAFGDYYFDKYYDQHEKLREEG